MYIVHRALSSAGRAFGLHPKCREFDPLSAHSHPLRVVFFYVSTLFEFLLIPSNITSEDLKQKDRSRTLDDSHGTETVYI